MKRGISLLLVLAMLLGVCASALADDGAFNVKVIKEESHCTIDELPEKGVAFVESNLEIKSRAFEHSKESAKKYSSAKFDLLMRDWFTDDPWPIWRLWFDIFTDDRFYDLDSCTITLGGKDYTFTNISDSEWYYEVDGCYEQELLIRFGTNNLDFLVAMENEFVPLPEDTASIAIPIVFHGREDITANLGEGFVLEFALFRLMMVNANGLSMLSKTPGDELTVE